MVDSRDGRVLADGQREMLDTDEWQWLERQVREPAPYFLLGTSLPVLLPPGPHDLERITTVACAGRWGKAASRIGEELRQAAQLSHWASFPSSFAQAARLLRMAADHHRQGVIILSGTSPTPRALSRGPMAPHRAFRCTSWCRRRCATTSTAPSPPP